MTERGRRVVYFAQEEARDLGEDYVSTEHLLLGLIREDDCLAVLLLEQMELPAIHVRAEIEKHLTRATGNAQTEMHLTDRAKRVIQIAYDEAQNMGNSHIGTEHLLLGLIGEEGGIAGRIFSALGADSETAKEILKNAQGRMGRVSEDTLSSKNVTRTRLLESVGHIGVLIAEGRTAVEAAVDHDALLEMVKVLRAQDAVGYQQMLDSGKMLLLPAGVEVKRLAADGYQGIRVRVREGEHKDNIYWVLFSNFQEIKADDTPFPPIL
jgi:ATP-dependent Clp protease ATP-binding subunit ClpA